MKRRTLLRAALAGSLVRMAAGQDQSRRTSPSVVKNRAPLAANSYYPLPLTSVRPTGWLRDQLRLQADAITGHLDEFWPDLSAGSAWRGGPGEGWERGPYYLDGLVPLAFTLNDERLIAKARQWVDWTLTHQRPDGAIGPEKNLDWWPNFIMLKVLTQYQEATGDERVIPLMQRYFAYMAKNLPNRPLHEWAIYRWQDQVLTVLWLYNRTGDKSLLELAQLLRRQGHDWKGQFANFRYTEKVGKSDTNLATHNVNNAMALKTDAVWSTISGKDEDREASRRMLAMLDRYHGLPNGMFSGSEHYAGRSPSQGIELCGVVEAMFSLEQNLAILGDPALGDRIERIAYNALPGTMSADLWSHQYDQQPNQVLCSLSRRDWVSNGPESNLFGLEPNFGCCTANLHQGWPKLVSHLWMATPDDGLAAVVLGPSEVRMTVRGGVPVTISEETEYPFRGTVRFTVRPDRATAFPLVVRIPGWAEGAQVSINGQQSGAVRAGTFHRLERTWQPGDTVQLTLPLRIRVRRNFNDAAVIDRGPLVFSLQMGESWRKVKQTGPVADWEVYPTSAWNYGLQLDEANVEGSFQVEEAPVGKQPFSVEGAPVRLKAKGRRLPEWALMNDSAAPPPASPVKSTRPEETLTLLPYGAARLRVTTLPILSKTQQGG